MKQKQIKQIQNLLNIAKTHTTPFKRIFSYNFIRQQNTRTLEKYQRDSHLNDVISDSIHPMQAYITINKSEISKPTLHSELFSVPIQRHKQRNTSIRKTLPSKTRVLLSTYSSTALADLGGLFSSLIYEQPLGFL